MKTFAIVFTLLAFTLGASPAQALQIVNSAQLQKGEVGVRTGFNYLFGLISPPPTFGDHVSGPNKAALTEEYFAIAYGLGDLGLKDLQLEVRGTLFQSGKETFNGALVHPADDGG